MREFIVNALHGIHHVTEDKAIDIAANWKYGSGSALTLFDVDTFRPLLSAETDALMYLYIVGGKGGSQSVNEKQIIGLMTRKDLLGLQPGGKC